MFCNNCGKKNADGVKFCVNCGAPLNQPASPADAPVKNYIGKFSIGTLLTPGRKKGIIALFSIIVVLIAAINIISVYRGILNVSIRDEEQEANRMNPIYETNGYIYYTYYDGGLYRVNKTNNELKKLTNKNVNIIATASNYIICADGSTGNHWYKVTDKSGELDEIGNYFISSPIIRGKYNYSVSGNGLVSKSLNCGNYGYASFELNKPHSSQYSFGVKAYRNYIYMVLCDNFSQEKELVRVSMKNGKEETLGRDIEEFTFSGDYIIFQTSDNVFGKMDLDGDNSSEYLDIDPTTTTFFCNNGYVYYTDGWVLCRFDVESGVKEELDGNANSRLTGINGGLAYLDADEFHLLDYSGNEIAILRP